MRSMGSGRGNPLVKHLDFSANFPTNSHFRSIIPAMISREMPSRGLCPNFNQEVFTAKQRSKESTMQIVKTVRGWLLEPSTDEEEKALDFLLMPLTMVYSKTTDADEASRIHLEARDLSSHSSA